MAANSSVYFLRFQFADESEILPGFSFMNESKKKYVIILIILDKLRFIIEKSYKNMTMHTFIAFSLFFPYTISGYPFCIYTRSAISYSSLSESSQPRQGSVMDLP